MAQPITWQNVNGPNLADALRPLQAAQSSFNGAFAGLGDILKERTAIDAANAVQINKNNVQSYLDEVARQGATPEQLQASIQSGQLEKLRASFGGGADFKAATRGAAENLLADRYKQVQAATEFGNTMLNEKTAPVMDRFKQATITGDKESMEKARAEYAALGGKHAADLESFAQNAARDNMKWDETKKGWVRDEAKFKQDIKESDSRMTIAQGQLDNARAQTGIAARNAAVNEGELQLRAEDMGFKREDRAEDRISKVSTALGALGGRNAGSAEGTETVYKAISQNIKDPASQGIARQAFAEMIKLSPGLTTAAALTGVLGTKDINWHTWDSTKLKKSVELAEKAMATPETKNQQLRAAAQEAVLLEQLKRAREAQQRLGANGGNVKNPFQ